MYIYIRIYIYKGRLQCKREANDGNISGASEHMGAQLGSKTVGGGATSPISVVSCKYIYIYIILVFHFTHKMLMHMSLSHENGPDFRAAM